MRGREPGPAAASGSGQSLIVAVEDDRLGREAVEVRGADPLVAVGPEPAGRAPAKRRTRSTFMRTDSTRAVDGLARAIRRRYGAVTPDSGPPRTPRTEVRVLGPIFMRELVTVPRRPGTTPPARPLVGLLGILGITTWQATVGFARDATLGETARFGLLLFQIVAFVQLLLTLFFAALSAAERRVAGEGPPHVRPAALTDMRDYEIVLGKLLGSAAADPRAVARHRAGAGDAAAARRHRPRAGGAGGAGARRVGGRGRVARRAGRAVARADVPGPRALGAVPRALHLR